VTVPLQQQNAYDMQPPVGSTEPIAWMRLAGTGGTGVENATALTVGQMATLLVGAAAVRVGWGSAAAGAEATTTSPILPAYGRFDWVVSASSVFVSVEAADNAAAFEAHVWTSSGAR